MLVGYIRVSARDQDLEAQRKMLEDCGCEKIFSEKHTGRSKTLPALEQAYEYLREGDTLCVIRVDRVARDMFGIPAFIKRLLDKDVHLWAVKQNIDTRTLEGRILIIAHSAFSEAEYFYRQERIEEARAVGRVGGRKKGLSKEAKIIAEKVADLYIAKDETGQPVYTISQIEKACGISKRTVYKYLKYKGVPTERESPI